MSHDEDKFLSRWSQKKADARKDQDTSKEVESDQAADENEGMAQSSDVRLNDEMLDESDFDDVDFEALDKSSDYTRFIKANVPASIQKLALRKLWDSDPVFEVLDGMNDYDEDFTGTGLAGKVLHSAYKVGKGYLNDEGDGEAPPDPAESEESEETSIVSTTFDSPPQDNTTETNAENTQSDQKKQPGKGGD